MGRSPRELWDSSSRSTVSPSPTRRTRCPNSRAAWMAPSTSGTGALSPPIASTAMVTIGWLVYSLLGGCFYDFAALVLTAMRANAMRHFGFVAVGALGVRGFAQGIVGAAFLSARVGVSSFRIRHLFLRPSILELKYANLSRPSIGHRPDGAGMCSLSRCGSR